MDDREFHQEQLQLFVAFQKQLQTLADAPGGETLSEIAAHYAELVEQPARVLDEAPALVSRMLTTTPQLAEHFPRDLLWYLGGECLHFMPDEEIDRLSALDEQRRLAQRSGDTFDWREARARALRLQ